MQPAFDHNIELAPPALDVIDGLARVAALRPEAIAVEAQDAVLEFGELDELSSRLASRLRERGVGPEVGVAIALPRGAGELVTMLATLKAGGAYVPLDPSHPADRLRQVLEDAQPHVLVSESRSPLLALVGPGTEVVSLDDVQRAVAGHIPLSPVPTPTSDQLAYLLFTSGSTGRPKGVEIGRGALAHFLAAMMRAPGLGPHERVLAVTTTSFDIAALELFLPLVAGATVVIADRETARDPRRLRRRLETDGISTMQATPATWRLLLESGWTGDGRLRMLCGGEALSPSLARRLLAAGGELWNMYGPTEATVWCSLARIESADERITVGRPIPGMHMAVLDGELAPLPPGREGELWIGGVGLARGYHRRPDLTAERFIQHPRGGRLYRTGDLARQLLDGRFECLGRLDHQVKIRGFRIELGDIETALRSVPGVHEALVVADQTRDRVRLVAYWTGGASRAMLAEAARRQLPPYMVPQAYVPLDAFPLNTNGKIDRLRLPTPESVTSVAAQPPRTEMETRVATLWAQVLELPQVGVDQSFFDLGGDSALAVRTVVRMQDELGVELPLQTFFGAPTVQALAAELAKVEPPSAPDAPIVVRLRAGSGERSPLHCLLGVTLYQDLALALDDGQPVIGMHVPQRYFPGTDRHHAIVDLAARYVNVIRQHQPRGPYHLLGLCFGGIVAYEAACQLQAAGEDVGMVAVLDSILPQALRPDPVAKIASYARQAWHEPRRVPVWLRAQARRLALHLPWRLRPGVAGEVPVDGPENDALVASWSARPHHLRGHLLVVRASSEPRPPWLRVRADLGWSGLATRLTVQDIAAPHLQILREPQVHALAQAVARAMRSTAIATASAEP